MLFLSAQPDEFYFAWQLEIQLHNFKALNLLRENIHVIIGFDPKRKLRRHFKDLIFRHRDKAKFFTYADNRTKKYYAPSIRPHIIKQHLQKFPDLEKECIFYHDCDIIFRKVPEFDSLIHDENWYVSDTRDYLDSKYIQNEAGSKIFKRMCKLVGIDASSVISNDNNCGGAQYLLKNTTVEFWNKVEMNSESLYDLLMNHNFEQAELIYIKERKMRSEYRGINAWCADMWALFWNALLFRNQVKISPEIEFCWACDSIERWEETKILHYTGKVSRDDKSIFRKSRYVHYEPYFDDELAHINKNSCSYPLVNLINDFKAVRDKERIGLKDVSFFVIVHIASKDILDNLKIVVRFINKYFDTNIFVVVSKKVSRFVKSALRHCCDYLVLDVNAQIFHKSILNSWFSEVTKAGIAIKYDCNVIIDPYQIEEGVKLIRDGKADLVCPYIGMLFSVDPIFKAMLTKVLDSELLIHNKGKFNRIITKSRQNTVLIKRQSLKEHLLDKVQHVDGPGFLLAGSRK